jgi:hypothetical protein
MKKGAHLGFIIVAALLVTVSIADPAHAGWSRDPAVNTAITTQAGADTNPAITDDGAGGAIIAWMGPAYDIYVQRIDANGNLLWGANGKAITSAGNMYYPQLAGDGSVGAFITWQGGGDGSGNLYVQRVDGDGNALWTAGEGIICNEAGNHQYPQIVGDGAGGAVIAWQDSRSGEDDYDIYAQSIRSDADGDLEELWPANGLEICIEAGHQYYPQLVGDGSGGVIITWQDGRDGWDIYAQRIDADGYINESELWEINGAIVGENDNDHEKPQIVGDGSGGAIITWQELGSGGNGYDVYAQRIGEDGDLLWTEGGVAVSAGAEHQQDPQMVSDGSGGAIIAWWDFRDGANYAIYSQRINGSGTALWTANGVTVASPAGIDANNYSPRIAADSGHGAVITWADMRNGTERNIYAQRVDETDGHVLWIADGVPVSIAANHQQLPKLIAAGSGDFVVTWQDQRSGDLDIYAQKVLAAGTLPVVSPAVTTAPITGITATSATVGGNVTSDGGSAVTTRGVCWSALPDPAIGPDCISAGSGSGSFTGVINGLTPNTPYHVRAYATSTIGTSYGNDIAFTTNNKYGLNLTFAGTGRGNVSWGGTTCDSACTFLIDPNTTAQLQAATLPFYSFTSWSGACSGSSTQCSVLMDSDNRNVTATFTLDAANSVRIKLPLEIRYSSVSDAIRLDQDGAAVIDTWGCELTDSPTFDRGVFTLKGGWNSTYSAQSGATTINGVLTVKSGSVTVENLAIR